MDIRIGSTPPIGGSQEKGQAPQAGAVEARVLAVRSPRREAREKTQTRDPLTGRVLVLMIPDGSRLPEDLEKGDWRVLLRFARR